MYELSSSLPFLHCEASGLCVSEATSKLIPRPPTHIAHFNDYSSRFRNLYQLGGQDGLHHWRRTKPPRSPSRAARDPRPFTWPLCTRHLFSLARLLDVKSRGLSTVGPDSQIKVSHDINGSSVLYSYDPDTFSLPSYIVYASYVLLVQCFDACNFTTINIIITPANYVWCDYLASQVEELV